MKNFTKLFFAMLFAFTQAFTTQAQDLTLQGVMDFTVPGGGNAGKAIHLNAVDNITDLSIYGISVAANGNGADASEEYTFPAISVVAGDDILLARDTTVMLAYLSGCSGEFEHVLYATSSVTQNGDDAIQLWHNGVWVETFGDPDVDGTGETWEYVDTWAYRTSTTVANLSTKISDCGDFTAGPTAWPYVLTAVTASQGSISQGPQTFSMNVTSLPSGGANVRVYKTTANGSAFFGPPVALALGSNGITVGGVSFDRTVKFQFSSGDVEFDDLVLNGTSSDCPLPPPPSSLISDCGDFTAGPTNWPFVLTATTVADGSSSQGPQTFSMNVTSLPTGGANFRVYKTTANGSDFFGPPQAMTLGANGITVGGVSFDRTVKFQFSSGDVIFDALTLNGVASDCAGPPAFVESDWNIGALNCTDATVTIYDASCMYPICNNDFVLDMSDSFGDGWNGNTWTATGTTSGTVYGPFTIASGSTGSASFSSSDYCFTITCGGGSFTSEVGWSLEDAAGTVLLAGGAPYSGSYGNCTAGCTDPLALNYDGNADIDDGSCTFACLSLITSDYNESFEAGVGQWTQGSGDDIDWTIGSGGTPSGSTGPSSAYDGSYYIFLEASGNSGNTAELNLDCIDRLSWTNPHLVFNYHMYGASMGTLNLDLNDGAGWVNIWTMSGDQGNLWNTATIDLSAYSSAADFNLRFSGTVGTSFTSDMAIDLTQLIDTPVYGCTDVLASNYNPTANVNDGTCNYAPCTAPAPYHETFSSGALPLGYCFPSQWATSVTTGDGWRFTGNPGYQAGANGRTAGTYAWVDFSGTDAGTILEVEDIDVSTLTNPTLFIDYFSDMGTYTLSGTGLPNALHIEGYDGTSWVAIDTLQLIASGWNTYNFALTGALNGTIAEIRFRAEGGGAGNDFYNDLLLDDVKITSLISGCTDSTYSNYDPLATVDDGSCINSYTLYMFDSFGDGWNGNTWTATGLDSGTIYGPFFISSGLADSAFFTSTDNCFSVVCDFGAWQSEVSWDLQLSGSSILTGGAPYTGSFGNNCISGCTDPAACNYDPSAHFDDGSCVLGDYYTVNLYDSFGDGWNGNTLTLTDQSGTLFFSTTLATGLTGVDSFCTDILSSCYNVVCGGGSWQSEVSWDIVDATGAILLSGGAPYTGNFGTCILGCTDPTALNYDATATVDDGGCISCGDTYTVNLYDSWGDGWNGNTLVISDTSGTVLSTTLTSGSSGTDSFCANLLLSCYDITCGGGSFASEVSWEIVDSAGTIVLSGGAPYTGTLGTCVYGCTDPTAINYDATATVDDGSCTSCDIMTLIMNDSFGDGWNGNRWQLVDLSGNIFYDTTLTTGLTDTLSVCVLAGNCYEVVVDGGAWQGEVSWSLLDNTGTTVLSGGAPYSGNYIGTGCAYGCLEPLADNYDPTANLDDGSCSYANCVSADTTESFEGSISSPSPSIWAQSTDDDLDWTPWTGSTSSSFTGPSSAYDGVNYIYLETSTPAFAGQTASIITPCVDLSAWNNPSLVFAYHMNGQSIATLMVEVSDDGGLSWDSVWALSGPQGDQWYYTGVDLGAYSGTVAVKFTGSVGASFSGDMALDAIGFEELPVFACMDPNASNYDATATNDDGSCTYATTFNVDMGCQTPGSFTSVSVESPDLSCYGGCITLSDPDGDDVWSVTLDLVPGNYIYVYAIDNNSSQENLVDDVLNGNGSCAPYTDFFSYANREVIVGVSSITADDTYGSCDPCIRGCMDLTANNYDSLALVDDGTCEYDVTFVVDMTCSGLTPTTLAATGPADNWSGNTYLLTDADGDGVWEGTYSVTDNFVYLYVVDTWADSEFAGLFNEMLNGTNSCAPYTDNLSYAYRLASSPSTTSDIYGQCSACPPGCTDPAASNFDASASLDDGSCVYATTFNVDMNCEPAGSFGYVHLESPVFGWCGGCVPMTDPDGDGVHSVTVDLPLGNFEYKYAVDSWAGQEDLIDDMQNGASCAPVTDYFSYANRLVDVMAGTVLDDTYGSCDICDQVNGCTDAGAINYDAFATDDDGSCLFSTTFNVDMNCEPAGSFGYVHLESPVFGWCGGCVPMTDPDGDGVHSVTVDLPAGNFEYKYAVDGFAGQEDLIDDMVGGASCAPVTDYFSYANRLLNVNGLSIGEDDKIDNGDFSNGQYRWSMSNGFAVINEKADLWKQNSTAAVIDQANVLSAGLTYQVTFDAEVVAGSFEFREGNSLNGLISVDSSGTYSATFVASNSFILFISISDTCDLTIDNITIFEATYNSAPNTSDTYSSCSECILGCMDSLAFNYNDSALVDDGSCLYGYNCPAPYPIGLSSSDIYAEMATIHWADANSGSCRVEKYFVRYREVGTLAWTTKSAGAGSGLCNVGLPNTSKVLRNLMPSTTYEFKMKAFYCGGGESGYSYVDQFTTLDACPEMDTLMVETFSANHAKARFTWTETGPYTFARVALRVNTPGSSWQTAGGFGVFYPTLSVNKFGLNAGTEYRAQGRTFCDVNVTSYRSDWTSIITWTQPGVAPIRLEGGSAINNLEVYPNPSKDIFNVSFVSEDIQNLEVRVLNMVGELVYSEGLEQFVGEYTKSINMSKYTKGVYFLEITTNNGVVNKKIVLQ